VGRPKQVVGSSPFPVNLDRERERERERERMCLHVSTLVHVAVLLTHFENPKPSLLERRSQRPPSLKDGPERIGQKVLHEHFQVQSITIFRHYDGPDCWRA